MRQRGFSTWGIQTGPFAACGADFVQLIFHLFYFHTGESNYLLPQREGLEMRKGIPPTVSETQGFQYLGHSNWTICRLLTLFCPKLVPPPIINFFSILQSAGARGRKRNSPKLKKTHGFLTLGHSECTQAKFQAMLRITGWCKRNVPCLKIPALTAATHLGLPWTAQSANFGKFHLNSLNLAPFLLLNPVMSAKTQYFALKKDTF